MQTADVLVVGAGLAGLRTAGRLAERGHDVLLVDRRASLAGPVRTTGIFVRRTLEDFRLPEEHLGPPVRRVVLHPPDRGRPVTLDSGRDEFRVGDMAGLYVAGARAVGTAGARVRLGTRYVGRLDGVTLLEGPDGPLRVRARVVVGADGARSRVARDLGLDRNRHLLVGAEEVTAVAPHDRPPAFHCIVDPSLAPGYVAWVVDDGRHAHLGVAGYGPRFPHGLRRALADLVALAPGLTGVVRTGPVERRAGPVPVGGLLRRISCPAGVLVGDAAGAVSPLTAGGLDLCLRLSDAAVDVVDEALRTGRAEVLRGFDGAAERARSRRRLPLRHGLAQVRSPAVAAAAFVALRTPPGRAVARRVVFG